MKNSFFGFLGSLMIIAAAVLFFFKIPITARAPHTATANWSQKLQLEYVNTLLARGLSAQAALSLKEYSDKNPGDAKTQAKLCYRLGTIFMDLALYENALASFYKAELLDGQAEFIPRMNELIVEALEKAGLGQQAEYELSSRTSITEHKAASDTVVAQIAKREITMSEIDKEISGLPEGMAEAFSGPEGKLRYIKEYVAREVLHDRAKKLGLDKSTKVRQAVEDFKKQIVLQQLLVAEMAPALKISSQDVEMYYKANKDNYTVPQAVKVSYVVIPDPAKKDEALSSLSQGHGSRIDGWIVKGQTSIGEISDAAGAIDVLIRQEKGSMSEPIKIKDTFYVFSIADKRQERLLSFDEVKKRAESEYRRQKQEELLNSLLTKVLESKDVKILYQPDLENEKTKH